MSKPTKDDPSVRQARPQRPGRFLRSHQLRALLWYAADGKCQRCGAALGPGWHADHVVPWTVSHRTEVGDMQALCRACNLSKGAGMLRRHQKELKDLLEDVRQGHRAGRTILAWVTCGGGKSALAVIAAHVGIPRLAAGICYVAPRQTLQEQVEENFQDAFFRRELGHAHEVRRSTNRENPCRGLAGYVTTYQALQDDEQKINLREFERRDYILILDEFHHVAEGGAYHRAVQPLVDRATVVILMSATLERADGQRVAFLTYRTTIEGRRTVDLETGMPVIRYSRQDALAEKAVVPLLFEHLDGEATWVNRKGVTIKPLSLSLAGKHTADAIFTILRTDYARHLLERCVRHWTAYRARNQRSRLLVVAPSIKLARVYLDWLKDLGVGRADIATSEDPKKAAEAIGRFKGSGLDALVTVAMAYEGLDCPQITHVACLTHIRSRSWIEQLISRANRVDAKAGPYASQRGWIYAPDDELMVEIFEEIKVEQEPYLREVEERGGSGDDEDGGGREDLPAIIPLGSEAGRVRAGSFEGESLNYLETEVIETELHDLGLEGVIHATDALSIYERIQRIREHGATLPARDEGRDVTPSRREQAIKQGIEAHCRGWDHDNGEPFGTLNRRVYDHFGKSRENMDEEELRAVWAWLNREFPRHRSA